MKDARQKRKILFPLHSCHSSAQSRISTQCFNFRSLSRGRPHQSHTFHMGPIALPARTVIRTAEHHDISASAMPERAKIKESTKSEYAHTKAIEGNNRRRH